MHEPPESIIRAAEAAARQSPCEKSKRGAALYTDAYLDGTEISLHSTGFNGPPGGIECFGSDECRRHCAMRCNHAEERALRALLQPSRLRRFPLNPPVNFLVMLHIKVIDDRGVAGGGPGCVMCSRTILDSGIIHGIWLFQTGRSVSGRDGEPDRWRYWEALDFHRETCAALGIA